MAQNILHFGEKEERILGLVKAQQNFKNKNQALEFVLNVYSDSFLEPELRPSFVNEMRKIERQKGIPFENINELRRLTSE